MSLDMPPALQEAFSWLGLEWPQADEDKLFAAGTAWTGYAERLREVETTATAHAAAVWDRTTGDAATAFRSWWESNPQQHLDSDADGADTIGGMLQLFGGLTVALKGVYIAQLAILAAEIIQAIATAFITFGASLAEIPVFAAAVRVIVRTAIDKTIEQVLA